MPIYEYECQDKECGERTEDVVRSHEEKKDTIECRECGKEAIPVLSRSSAHFKGTGWTPRFH
jgi:putative FmdB family regulatory protein